MDNPRFVDDENMSLVHDEYIEHNDYNTPNTSRVDETSLGNVWFHGKRNNVNFTVKTKSKTR